MSDLKLVWMDLEMTGLDPESCAVIELAIIVTGDDLVPIEELERVVWQPEEVLARTSPFVRDMHTKNGLLAKVRTSPHGLEDVQRDAIALVAKHCKYREGVLAGNSIHQDRRFLQRHLPQLEGFLHYRQVDVSSLKVLVQAWKGRDAIPKKEDKNHTALDDIRASIAELAQYRALLFGT